MVDATVARFTGAQTIKRFLADYKANQFQPKGTEIGLVEVSPHEQTCCYDMECRNTSYSIWGALNVSETCIKLPFNTTCIDKDTWLQTFPSTELPVESLCSELPLPRAITAHQRITVENFPPSSTDPPHYAEFFFTDVGDLPVQVVLNSSWVVLNGSANICSDESLIDLSTELSYSKFRLTSSGVQVGFKQLAAYSENKNYAIF